MIDFVKGSMLMMISAFCFSIVALTFKWGSILGFSSSQMVLCRCVVQTILVSIYSFISIQYIHDVNVSIHEDPSSASLINKSLTCTCQYSNFKQDASLLSIKSWKLIITTGIFQAIGLLAMAHAITILTIGDTVTIVSLYPIFTAFVAKCVLNEHLTLIHIICLLLSVIGIIFIAQPSCLFGDHDSKSVSNPNPNSNSDSSSTLFTAIGYIECLSNAFLVSCVIIMVRKSGNTIKPIFYVFSHGICTFFAALLMCGIWQYFSLNGLFLNDIKWESWVCILLVGISGFVGQWTFNKSAQLISAGLSSLIRSSDIIWAYLWQICFWHQIPNGYTISGALLICTAIVVICVEKMKTGKIDQTSKSKVNQTLSKFNSDRTPMAKHDEMTPVSDVELIDVDCQSNMSDDYSESLSKCNKMSENNDFGH